MTQTSFRLRLPRSWALSPCEARNAALPLLVLASLAAVGGLPAVGWGPGVLVLLALGMAALVRPRRAALLLAMSAGLVGLSVLLAVPGPAVAGVLLAFLSPLAARR